MQFSDFFLKSVKYGFRHSIKEKIIYFLTIQIIENQDKFFDKFAEDLLDKHKNDLVYAELEKHKKNTDAVLCIVSASPDLWIKKVAARLGTAYICTICEYKNQKFTGRFVTKNCNRKEKAKRLSEKYDRKEFSCVVSYGNNLKDDGAMFEWSDVAYLVRNNELYNVKNEQRENGTNL